MQPKVLVIDDDDNIRSAFEEFFRKEHCTMITASTAENALAYLEKHHVDLLISDLEPKADSGTGFSLKVKVLRPNLPVILIADDPETIKKKEITSFGADDVLVKPLEIGRLRSAVRACLRKQ